MCDISWRHHTIMTSVKDRLRAAGIHLGISLCVAAVSAALVFGLWYPTPYREISGGRELFILIVSVDVVLGPLITLAIFNRAKPWPTLRRDLGVVGLIQCAALAYGLWTVFVARPVHLVFEFDRMRVVHALDVPDELVAQAPPALRRLPLSGPTLIALRPFRDGDEKMQSTLMALQGLELAAQPGLWRDYESARPDVIRASRPIAQLRTRFPQSAADIDTALATGNLDPSTALYLPLVGRKTFWTVLIDPKDARPAAFLPLDSF